MRNSTGIEPALQILIRLKRSARVLSLVIGLFVGLWTILALHIVLDIFFPQVSHISISWGLAGLMGLVLGTCSGCRIFSLLSNYIKDR